MNSVLLVELVQGDICTLGQLQDFGLVQNVVCVFFSFFVSFCLGMGDVCLSSSA